MTRNLQVISTNNVFHFFQGPIIIVADISQRFPEALANFTKRVALEEKQFHRFLLLPAQLLEGLPQTIFALRQEGVVLGGDSRFEYVKTIVNGLFFVNMPQGEALPGAVGLVICDLNQPCSKRSALRVK